MPAPTDITALSTTAASNSPAGTESPIIADDCLRAAYSFIALLRDGASFTSFVRAGTGGTAAIPAFSVNGDGNTGAWFPAANTYSVSTDGTEALRVDSSQRLLLGPTTSVPTRISSTTLTAKEQIAGTVLSGGSQLLGMFSATAASTSSYLAFARSRNGTIGSHTAIVAGDVVGNISFAGSDGTNFTELARIRVSADSGTVATDTVYGQIEFMTTNGAAAPTTCMTINASGSVDMDGPLAVTNNSTFGGSLTANSFVVTNNSTFGGTIAVTGAANLAGAFSATGNCSVDGNLLVQSSTSILGYGIGSGGTVTQATSKSTGVTIDRASGQITTHAASLGAGTSVSFTVTNSVVGATDVVIANIASGATANTYSITVDAVAAGSFRIHLRNISGSAAAEALVINFAAINGSSS